MRTRRPEGVVSLWDMLTLLSGGGAFGGALAAGRVHGGGARSLLICVLAGGGLAVLSVIAVHRAGHLAFRSLRLGDDSTTSGSLLPLLYFAKFLCVMALAPAISFMTVSALVRITVL